MPLPTAKDIAEIYRKYADDEDAKVAFLENAYRGEEIPADVQKAIEWGRGLATIYRGMAERALAL
jgi:hypothetical protein